MVSVYKTPFSGYSVEFSPFEENKLAVASAQHFGIVGNGKLHILDILENGSICEVACFDSRDGLYDCSWSEDNENLIACASGDGSVKVWDIRLREQNRPIRSYQEHASEVYSVDWNQINKQLFITGSWDETIKLWDPINERGSLMTFHEHTYCVYSTIWAPLHPDRFISASGDCTVKIWDIKSPRSVQTIRAHDHEILTCDWNKYNEFVFVTGSVDKSVKLWDIRYPERELGMLRGHGYAIRRLKCSPHNENILATSSYDMSLVLWDVARDDPLLHRYEHHSEFVVGLDFNIFIEGEMASCCT